MWSNARDKGALGTKERTGRAAQVAAPALAMGVEMQSLPATVEQAEVAEEGREEGEALCFVCLEPCVNVTKCKCKDRHAHATCLLKWLETKKSNRCDVCLEQYDNVHLRIRSYTSTRPSAPCWGSVLGCAHFVCTLIVGSLQLSLFLGGDGQREYGTTSLAMGIFMVAMSNVGLVLCVVCAIRFRHEGCNFRTTRHSTQVVMSVDCPRVFV